MFVIVWEYQVKPERQTEFESIYSAHGAWVALFEQGDGYLGTDLLRDHDQPQRYLTLDRWNSREEYENFLLRWEKEYKALDAHCEGLTERESLVGKWYSA